MPRFVVNLAAANLCSDLLLTPLTVLDLVSSSSPLIQQLLRPAAVGQLLQPQPLGVQLLGPHVVEPSAVEQLLLPAAVEQLLRPPGVQQRAFCSLLSALTSLTSVASLLATLLIGK